MSERKVAETRVAIAGAGLMGRWHADAAARAGGRVVGVCDPNYEAAASLAKRAAATHVEMDLDTLLAKATPDVVHICTPLLSHAQLSERALLASADAIVEKPLAASAAETARLLALAREHAGYGERGGERARVDGVAFALRGGRGREAAPLVGVEVARARGDRHAAAQPRRARHLCVSA